MSAPFVSEEIAAVLRAVPRTHFLPAHQHEFAGRDAPLDIGGGQTCSQPSTVGAMLTLLEVLAGQRVLDVGAGSGWTTALLAHLVGPTGRVVGVELDPDLAAWGAANLERSGAGDWARIEPAEPGILGWPREAPYDRVLVSAMAKKVPEELVRQVREGGLMVAPVDGMMCRIAVLEGGERVVTRHGHYRFVPLR